MSSVLYDRGTAENTALIESAEIELFENLYAKRDYTITIDVPEFTSVCPKTGLPDFGTIQVRYVPDTHCIELKSFKYYILKFRNEGIFYEQVVNKILDDIVAACNPRYVSVEGNFTARGGISTVVQATHQQATHQQEGVVLNG